MQLVTKANFDVQKYTKISEDKTNLHKLKYELYFEANWQNDFLKNLHNSPL